MLRILTTQHYLAELTRATASRGCTFLFWRPEP